MKRSPLRRKKPMWAQPNRMRSKPAARRSKSRAAKAYAVARGDAMLRAKGRCEARCSPRCRIYGSQAHHKLRRSQGGADTADNLLWVCDPCHRWIHDHPARSFELGLLVRRCEG